MRVQVLLLYLMFVAVHLSKCWGTAAAHPHPVSESTYGAPWEGQASIIENEGTIKGSSLLARRVFDAKQVFVWQPQLSP